MKSGLESTGAIDAWSYSGPDLGSLDASDHRNYWMEGYPAVMVTDTSFLRNPHHHTAGDLPETLDDTRMAAVVDGIVQVVLVVEG